MLKTSLYEEHLLLKAKMVDFAGWNMPVQYTNLIEEHLRVRNKAGLFDVSHMGTFRITGSNAFDFLQKMIPNDLALISKGKAIYSQFCNPEGGTVDDLIIYWIDDNIFYMVVNASNVDKDFLWLNKNLSEDNVILENLSDNSSIIALQGPMAEEILLKLCPAKLNELASFSLIQTEVKGHPAIVSRTGYTGEDGFEIITEDIYAPEIWRSLLEAGKEEEILPIGLGARDTLRLEATLPLYGHELDDKTSPLEARLTWSVKFNKTDFIGKEALQKQKEDGLKKRQIGLKGLARIVPREGYELVDENGALIGKITSGTFSPSFNYPVALAYVDNKKEYKVGDILQVSIRGKNHPVEIVKLPFYKRNRSN